MVYSSRKDDYHFIRWAQEVKRRDHWTCQICGRRGVELNSHHIKSWSDNPEDRYDLENGICLCRTCHDTFHNIQGKGGNTAEQLEEFNLVCEALIRTASFDYKVERSTKDAIRLLDGYQIATRLLEDLEQDGYGRII